MIDLLNERKVICRKRHYCGWCAEEIPNGEIAVYRFYILDGQPVSEWMHTECSDAMKLEDPDILADGWEPGDYMRGTTTRADEYYGQN